ncbi:MAG: hypothetical protein LBC95_01535 [Candidatus Nomurabacteria bacterium]|nr:hypothetical protein [Candidatus Nomurabacteria bacterium]
MAITKNTTGFNPPAQSSDMGNLSRNITIIPNPNPKRNVNTGIKSYARKYGANFCRVFVRKNAQYISNIDTTANIAPTKKAAPII